MKLVIPYYYSISFLPTKRHTRKRAGYGYKTMNVSVTEMKEEDFPVALRVTDYKTVCSGSVYNDKDRNRAKFKLFTEEYRTFGGKLFVPFRDRHGAVIQKEPRVFDKQTLIEHISHYNSWKYRCPEFCFPDQVLLTDKSVILQTNEENVRKEIRRNAKRVILFGGHIWVEAPEPMYNITTFGLGHNHGGTGFFIDHHYNDNIPAKNYFNALQREEAMKRYIEVATNRGDTESVEREKFEKNIEVLRPEVIKRMPAKEHGDGDPFLNKCEGIIEACGDPLSAGLLVMAAVAK